MFSGDANKGLFPTPFREFSEFAIFIRHRKQNYDRQYNGIVKRTSGNPRLIPASNCAIVCDYNFLRKKSDRKFHQREICSHA